MWIGFELVKRNWIAFSIGFAAVLGVVALIIARYVKNAPGGSTLWTILGCLLMGIGIGYLIGVGSHSPFVSIGDIKEMAAANIAATATPVEETATDVAPSEYQPIAATSQPEEHAEVTNPVEQVVYADAPEL